MGSKKVAEVNLERGWPTVEEALRETVSRLMTCKGQGVKAVILIHGYGSSGAGGRIGPAVRSRLRESSLRESCAVCTGEDWINKSAKCSRFVPPCPSRRAVFRVTGALRLLF